MRLRPMLALLLPALACAAHDARAGGPVFWVGAVHGGLFVLYAVVAFWAWGKGHLSDKLLGYAALASIIPFGPFVIDRKLKAAEAQTQDTTATQS